MEALIRWERLLEEIRPYYPKAGKGRAPYGLESVLGVHCVHLFYNLSDPATEDILYEIERVRRFTGISLSKVSDETTILNFRRLLERHGLPQVLFESIKEHLSEEGLMLKEGTIVDAGIMEAPRSRKNRKRERDPEMKQTRKGNQWHFGMKLHVGVDDQSGLVHSLATTSAKVHDLRACAWAWRPAPVAWPAMIAWIRKCLTCSRRWKPYWSAVVETLVEQHLHFVRQAHTYYAMQKGGIVASGPTADLS